MNFEQANIEFDVFLAGLKRAGRAVRLTVDDANPSFIAVAILRHDAKLCVESDIQSIGKRYSYTLRTSEYEIIFHSGHRITPEIVRKTMYTGESIKDLLERRLA